MLKKLLCLITGYDCKWKIIDTRNKKLSVTTVYGKNDYYLIEYTLQCTTCGEITFKLSPTPKY